MRRATSPVPIKLPGSAADLRSGDKKGRLPMENYGLRSMSTGFRVPNETGDLARSDGHGRAAADAE
jgi:hypothetical protein